MNKVINLVKAFSNFIIYMVLQVGLSMLLGRLILSSDHTMKSAIYIGIEIVTLLVLCLINRKKLLKDFKDFDKNYKKYLAIGFKAWIIGFVVMCVSNLLINTFVLSNIASNEQVDRLIIDLFPLYSVISMIFIGPFIEELAFRLGFKQYIKNKALYYILSVTLFAGMHVLNSIENPLELLYFIPYGALAVSFSYTLDKTDNIFTTTVVHTLHNLFAIIVITIYLALGV